MRQLELWGHDDEQDVQAQDVELSPLEVTLTPPSTQRFNLLGTAEPAPLEGLALGYLRAARAESTLASYESDWRQFVRWCAERGECSLPTSIATLACYLAYLASTGRKASTIRRARTSIGAMHCEHGLPRPDRDDRIRTLERGIGKVHGSREEGATPLLVPELKRMIAALGDCTRDVRDRALILVGFGGAFRSSELVALDVRDITMKGDCVRVHVRRSKEDPRGKGADTEVLRAHDSSLCPVAALERWLDCLAEEAGPLFRTVHGPHISPAGLAPRAVTRAVQRAAARAGLPQSYSSHSLRSGLATSAHAQGRSSRDIQAHGRWKDLRSLDRYIDVAATAARNVVAGLL